jgi:hypothetical protein
MKAVKIAGLISVLVAANAMAYTTATWTVAGPASVVENAPVPWAASVALTAGPLGGGSSDASQGMANYAITIELRNSSGALVPIALSPANFTQSFKVGGLGPADVKAINTDGGPGYEGPSSAGTVSTPGKIAGMSAGYGLPWKYPRYTRGIGLPGSEGVLMGAAAGTPYVINDGVIDTTGLAQGTYTVKLVVDSTFVLKTYKGTTTTVLNWDTTLTSLPSESAVKVGSLFTFEIVPEPATMLLLAGAGLFLRRRTA